MGDGDLDQRFQELRVEESRSVPRFDPTRVARGRVMAWRGAPAMVVLLLFIALITTIGVRSRRPAFSEGDRAAFHAVSAWQSPTDFLLRTPGSDILATTPAIPDLGGVLPPQGAIR